MNTERQTETQIPVQEAHAETEQAQTPKKKLPIACTVLYILGGISLILYVLFRVSVPFADFFNGTVGAAVRRALARRREKRAIRYTERESCAYIQAAARGFDLPAGEEKNS